VARSRFPRGTGGNLVVDRLTAPGEHRSTEPLPIGGEWKPMIGSTRAAR
jgi:hypothetical protein